MYTNPRLFVFYSCALAVVDAALLRVVLWLFTLLALLLVRVRVRGGGSTIVAAAIATLA